MAMIVPGGALARDGCKCRANGAEYSLNQEACIHTNGKSFQARCVLVLNNTSWKRIGDCPQARILLPGQLTVRKVAAMSVPTTGASDRGALCEPARWTGKAAVHPGS